VARTGCQHLGLLVGQQANLDSLGLVGLLIGHSPDVETALRRFARYLHLQIHGGEISLAVDGPSATLRFAIQLPDVEAADQHGDGAVAVMFNVLKSLCGPKWAPTEVHFAHPRPVDTAPYRRFFKAPLRFGSGENGLVFETRWLQRRLSDVEPAGRRRLQDFVDALDARHGNDFPEKARAVLRTAMVAGHGKADQVAAIFSMHSRTLNRRLNASGTSFRKLADEVRFDKARELLETTTARMALIASILGYSDQRAFTRAFSRWSGATPLRWRAARRRPQPKPKLASAVRP
jgi:AraC-like DNA-binding protein